MKPPFAIIWSCFLLFAIVAANYPVNSPVVGIRQDQRYRKPGHNAGFYTSFTGSIRVNKPNNARASDEEVAGFVAAAYAQMVRSGISTNNRPGVMTGLAVGNQIYFGSSIKGGSREQLEPIVRQIQIRALLRLCMSSTLTEHIRAARCGEFNAMKYYSERNGQIPTHDSSARIVTVLGRIRGGQPAIVDSIKIEPPCGEDIRTDGFGCRTVMRQTNFRVLSEKTAIGLPRKLPRFTVTS